MNSVGVLLSLPTVVWRRALSHLSLLLAVWAGLALAVGQVVAIPVYAEAAGYRILLASLAREENQSPLPPFAMVYRYGGASTPSVTWEQYQLADQLAGNLRASGIVLPAPPSVRFASTEKLRVMFPDGQGKEVTWLRFGFLSGIDSHIRIVQGSMPKPYTGSGPIEILVAESVAAKNTLLVDDLYLLRSSGGRYLLEMPVKITGIWRPADADANYWFTTPAAFSDVALVPEATFAQQVNIPQVPWVRYATWYTALDGTNVRSSDVANLSEQIQTASADIQQRLPETLLDTSPVEALSRQRDQVQVLIVTLSLFSVPLLGLLWYFISQVAGMLVQRQQQEVAVLRSRGSSRGQVLALALGEGLVVMLGATLAGVPLGLAIAQLIFWTQSFMRFALLPGAQPDLLPTSWALGATVAALALPAVLLPALRVSQATIVSYRQERARDMRPPFWQRAFLDILLLIPAVYGYQQLKLHGSLGVTLPGAETAAADDPFRNPLLLLAPALMVFSLALITLRFVPLLMRLLSWITSQLPGVALVTALRFLSRTPATYTGPMLLITLTLSMATFTASMARTLDLHSSDRAFYRTGADVRMAFPGANLTTASETDREVSAMLDADFAFEQELSASGEAIARSTDYMFIPIEDYLEIPGVQAASRVGVSRADIKTSTSSTDGTFLGVDRSMMAAVLADAWRADYAPESLGAIMNKLADSPQSALISATFAERQSLRVGDRFILTMNDLGTRVDIPFTVAGTLKYFPTLYSEGTPFVIGNLDYSFEQQSGQYPYEVWLKLAPGTSLETIRAAAQSYGLRVMPATPQALLTLDLMRPERQGLFGLLSVGFLATMLVTVIGFLSYTLLSFQRRMVEMGVLRAIGLSSNQLGSLLIFEQTLVIGIGALAGTVLGVTTSNLFVPFLQVRTGVYPDTPPFLVHIAWEQIGVVYAVAGVMLLSVVVATLVLLRRMRIFEAVKLGEAV